MPGNFASAQDLVSVDEIREDVVLLKDGSLRQVVMVGGVNFSLKSEGEQNLIIGGYQNFLNSLNFPIQIIIHSRKINIENYLKQLEERKQVESSGLLQDQIEEYREFVRQFVSEHAIMVKTFFVVVPFTPVSLMPTSKKGAFSFLPFGKKQPGAIEQEAAKREEVLKENISQLRQRTAQIKDGLGSLGLETLVLNEEAIAELFYNFYNPESVEKESIQAPEG